MATPVWITLQPWSLEGGEVKDFELKARRFSDGGALWELRRVLPIFIHRKACDIVVGKLLKRDLAPWIAWTVDLYGEHQYYSSHRAAASSPGQHSEGEYTEQEWTISSLGLVSLLVWGMQCRRSVLERRSCETAFLGMLRSLLGMNEASEVIFLNMPDEAGDHCRKGAAEGGPCECSVAFNHTSALGDGETMSWEKVGRRLSLMASTSDSCAAMRFWLGFVLFEVATHIDQVVQERASFTEDPLQSDAPSGPKRLKRVDEDVKMAAFDAVQGGRATSLPIFLRALADKRRSNANHWGDQMAMLELVKTRLCWMTGGVLSIACDDSRFSNPSEETMVFSVWHSSSGTGSWGIPQVKRDLKKSKARSTTQPTAEERANFKRKLEVYVDDHTARSSGQGAAMQEPRRVANLLSVKALDHMLQTSADLSLAHFKAKHALKPLGLAEVREWLPADRCDPRLVADGQRRRSIIRDRALGTVSLERKSEPRRQRLHMVSDRGACSWPAWFFLFGPCNLVGSFRWDEAHKSWDDPQNVISGLGMGSFMWCLVLAVNFCNGPWNTGAFLGNLRTASEEYFRSMDTSCPLFQFFYPQMHVASGQSSSTWGTPEAMDRVWQWYRSCPFFERKGTKTKLTRWFSLFDRLEEYLPWWWAMAAMTAFLAFQKGTFKSLNDLIEVSAAHLTTLEGKLEIDLARKGSSVGLKGKPLMKHDTPADAEAQRKAKGVLYCVTATVFSNPNRLLAGMLTVLVRPLRESHGKVIIQQSTRAGCLSFVSDMACGKWIAFERSLVKQMANQSVLREAGFSACISGGDDESITVEEEELLSHYAWDFVTRLVGARVVGWLMHSWSLPWRFYGLLSPRAEDVQGCLTQLRTWFELLEDAEVKSHGLEELRSVLADMIWPTWQWCRLVLVELAEHMFESVPPALLAELKDAAEGFAGTKVVEDGIGAVRRVETSRETGRVSRVQRWVALLQSSVLPDADRPGPPTTVAAKMAAASLKWNSELADAEAGECSFSDDMFDPLIGKGVTYRSPGPDALSMIPLWWIALNRFAPNFGTLESLWMTLLFQRGTLVQNEKDKRQSGLVLYVSKAGAVVWKMRRMDDAKSKQSFWSMEFAGDDLYQVVFVTDPKDWAVVEVVGCSPRLQKEYCEGCPAFVRDWTLRARRVCAKQTLLRHAAGQGFRGVTVPFLKKLWGYLGLAGPRPNLENALVTSLVKHVLGAGVDIQECLAKRARPSQLDVPVALTPATFENLRDGFDDLDVQKVSDAVQKDHSASEAWQRVSGTMRRRGASSGSGGAASSTPASASSSVAAAPRKEPPVAKNGRCWAHFEVRKLCPPGGHIKISRETKFAKRWRGEVLDAPVPNQISCKFDTADPASEQEAISRMLVFLWSVEERTSGQRCPWEFRLQGGFE